MPRSKSQPNVEPCSASFSRPPRATKSQKETRTPTSAPSASAALGSSANIFWTTATQREAFVQHLTNWASNHDSSAYFHGSISLYPQGVFPREVVDLGKSVNCILTDTSSGSVGKKIVVRLFQSQHHDGIRCREEQEETDLTVSHITSTWHSTGVCYNGRGCDRVRRQQNRLTAPYKLLIRSGSGWVPAREYLNKYHFAHPAKHDFQEPAKPSKLMNANTFNQRLESNTPFKQPDQSTSSQNRTMHLGPQTSAKETVAISPLFHPFLRLPPELQDAILYQAIEYTQRIRLTRRNCVVDVSAASKPPTTVSKLFRISKIINEHMTAHIFRSTNFHFGITGFTNFLWQVGPINRSKLQHLTFHFGKTSLLHCIRWLAPDPIYELFEPPVSTNPANLTYFWRCQLQDLMKELNLLTLTIDIRDVPLTDVPMFIRILDTAIGSIERIRVIDSQFDGVVTFPQDLLSGFEYAPKTTWRELSLEFYRSYKYQKWHMRSVWQIPGVDLCPLLQIWMNKEKTFFDS